MSPIAENHPRQVFDGNGKYEAQWNNLHRPCGLYMGLYPSPVALYPVSSALDRGQEPELGPRVSIVDNEGQALEPVCATACRGLRADGFIGPHGMCVEFACDLYVGEVS